MNRTVRFDLFQSHTPQLERSGRNVLLPFEVARRDLNYALVKAPIFAVLLQPDFLECFMTLEKKLLVELINALLQAWILLSFHGSLARYIVT